jgi:hypothetical protein
VSQSSEITPRIRLQILNLTTVDKITGDTLTSELGTFNATTEVWCENPEPLVWKPLGNAVQNHTRARPNAALPRQSGAVEIGIVSRGLVGIASTGKGDAVGPIDVTVPNSFNGEYMLRCDWGSVASSLCTTAPPLHTRFMNRFGASISEATMRPNPRCDGCGLSISGAEGTTVAEGQRIRGLLTGRIGTCVGSCSARLEIFSKISDVSVKVVAD